MKRDLHETGSEVFLAACDLPPEEREAYLRERCGDDTELVAYVRALLEGDSNRRPELDGPAVQHVRAAVDHAPPERIGGYRVLGLLGEGGMGVVYEAEQESPRRRVALKVLRTAFATEDLRRRFEHEAEVLGWLRHPGIAQVYESGLHDTDLGPQPFFAMELVQGLPLVEFARRRELGLRARLELLAKVCDAVHHAHQKGVIHRDLKPANILVEEGGQPRVLDFGVARASGGELDEDSLRTRAGDLVGTLAYMSPEQVSGDPSQLDTRSDVYALGVLAHELLTGRRPYDLEGLSLPAAVAAIREETATRLGTLDPGLRGDVETIVAKAMAKEKEQRYASAEELASDLRRFLGDVPIVARPPSAAYQLRKFARRNRALVAGFAAVFLVSVLGGAVALALYLEAEEERSRTAAALEQERLARTRAETAETAEREQRRRAEERMAQLRDMKVYYDGLLVAPMPSMEGPEVKMVEVLRRAALDVETSFQDQPLLRSWLLESLATSYIGLGLYEEALPFAEESVRLQEASAETDPRDLVDVKLGYGAALRGSGRGAEGRVVTEEAVELARSLDPPDWPGVLDGLLDLAASYQLSDSERATAYCDEVIALVEELGPAARAKRGEALGVLAGVLLSDGKPTEAVELAREALAVLSEEAGELDLHTVDVMNFLASALYQVRDTRGEAIDVAERALAATRKLVGDRHPMLIEPLMSLGNHVRAVGRMHDARDYYVEALDLGKEFYGYESGWVAAMLNNLGSLIARIGDLEESLEMLEESERISEKLGYERSVARVLPYTAITLIRLGRGEEALAKAQRAVEIFERRLPGSPASMDAYRERGNSFAAVGRHEEALRDFETALEKIADVMGDEHGEYIVATWSRTKSLIALGRHEEALRVAEENWSRADRVLSAQSWMRKEVRGEYGRALFHAGETEHGLQTVEAVHAELLERNGPDHERVQYWEERLQELLDALR